MLYHGVFRFGSAGNPPPPPGTAKHAAVHPLFLNSGCKFIYYVSSSPVGLNAA